MNNPDTVIAFQGEPGAYSEQAVRDHFGPEISTMPCRDFTELFASLIDGRSTHAMLPVENSLAGTVMPAYDLLIDHDLRVQAEFILRVEHCLMAPTGTTISDIKRVQSHYQALAQCEQNIRRMGWDALDYYDTAGAARDLAASPERGVAAIASELAAETYNLEILQRNFEDLDYNYTRFFVLGRTGPTTERTVQNVDCVYNPPYSWCVVQCDGRISQPQNQPDQNRITPSPKSAVALPLLRRHRRTRRRRSHPSRLTRNPQTIIIFESLRLLPSSNSHWHDGNRCSITHLRANST